MVQIPLARSPVLIAPFLLGTLLAFALPTQNTGDPTTGEPATPQGKPKKLDEWPDLEKPDRDRLLGCLGQFRKKNEELHVSAHALLVKIGAAGMPLLLQRVTDRPDNINAHLFAVCDDVLDERHAGLMVRAAKKQKVELRRYLVQRLARFVDRDIKPVMTAAMKDPDQQTAYYAALGALALGHKDAIGPVLAYSKTNWHEIGTVTAEVLAKARSNQKGSWLFEAIAKARSADQMAGLRLARYLATKDHLVILRTYLQAPDHAVKKEAVNAARVLHGQEPLEKLSVFQAIGMAKEWLQKI